MSLLSTSAFKHRPTLQRIIVTLVLVALAVCIADSIIGTVIQHTSSEGPFLLTSISGSGKGVTRLWSLAASGINPIVFVGSSEIEAGFIPDQFDSRILSTAGQQIHSVNLGVIGATARVTHNLLSGLIMPNHPKAVFLAVEMRALQAGSVEEKWYQAFLSTPIGYALSRPTALERTAQIWLLEHFSVLRYRLNMRRWLEGSPLPPESPVDANGHMILSGYLSRSGQIMREEFVPFHTEQAVQGALDQSAALCEQEKTDCVFLNMPLHPLAYQDITPGDTQAYWAIISEIAKTHGIPIWDFDTEACHKLFKDELFYDLNHFNEDGAKVFTAYLATLYIQQRINPSQPLGDNCAHLIP